MMMQNMNSPKNSRRAFLSATVASFAWLIVGDRASAAPANLAGTPCKVKGRERMSYPFFIDPSWDAV
ncbi:MAG: hypothetical protein ACKOBB_05935, partial [Acidimicrobiaceae bacterium]